MKTDKRDKYSMEVHYRLTKHFGMKWFSSCPNSVFLYTLKNGLYPLCVYLYLCVCLYVSVYVHMSTGHLRGERH